MATPTWQPATLYPTGSLVQPLSATPPAAVPIPNAGFESGNVEWDTPSPWVITSSGDAFEGTWSAEFATGFAGTAILEMDDFIPVNPGTSITASCQVQQGASSAGNTGARVLLRFYDSINVLIHEEPGNLVDNGSGGAWHQSTVTFAAPANTAFVRVACSGFRSAQNLPMWVDNFAWNLLSTAPLGLIFKAVQPNAGLSDNVEPVWPTVVGVQVVDNEVIWEAVLSTRITWEAQPILVSGATEPTFPAVEGATVSDGSIKWVAVSRRVTDPNCPNSKIVAMGASKIFAADEDIVAYSATVNPLDWSSANNAGYLPVNLQQYGGNPVSALGLYRGNLIPMNTQGSQVWQIDEDPAQMALLDAFPVGSSHHQAGSPAFNDFFFLPSLGVRSIGIAGGSTNLQAGDVGMPIDPLVQEALRVAEANGAEPMGTYLPAAGQYWLIIPNYPPDDPAITGDVPDGNVGEAASGAYIITGGVQPYGAVTVTSGTFPPGLTLGAPFDNGDGTWSVPYSGTRTTVGVYSWTVGGVDADLNPFSTPDTATVTAIPSVTWDAANKGTDVVLSNGDLSAQCNSFYQSVSATLARSSGQYQYEFTVAEVGGTNTSEKAFVGLAIDGADLTGNGISKIIGASSVDNSIGYGARGAGATNSGFVQWRFGGSGSTASTGSGNSLKPGDVMTVAVDLDADSVGFYLNGALLHTQALPSGQAWRPACSARVLSGVQEVVTANFGASAMAFPVVGYAAWDGSSA